MLQTLLDIDISLLIRARGLIGQEYALVVQILAESIVIFVMVFLVSLWIGGVRRKDATDKMIALNIFYTIILVFIVYGIINLGIPQWRPSPDEVAGGVKPLIPHPIGNSFPSGHALFSGALLIAIFRYYPKAWIIVTILLLGATTLSMRVIGGIHYPGDILGGLFFGIVGALVIRGLVESTYVQTKISHFLIKVGTWIRL